MAEADALKAFKTPEEIETSPDGKARRWLAELALAAEAEKEWQDEGQKCWELYRSKHQADNTFNIFWSNIETLRPAIYNSTPRPDVRRRFRDPDPVGKVASTVLQRALTFSIDEYDFDAEMKAVVLDAEVCGRGVVRVRYEPKFAGGDEKTSEDDEDSSVVYDETALCQHVQWDDFRRGPAQRWTEVPWIAFRHEFHYDELVEYFGEAVAKQCEMSEPSSDVYKSQKDDIKSLLLTCEVWEIWDRAQRRVIFISPSFKGGPLKEVDDPLRLQGFFPMPAPLYAIEDTTSLVPQIPYKKYEQQAFELNRVTYRINKIVNALKVRGAYDASLAEVPQILQAEDQDMIPVQNASQVQNMGGLDRAIWIMPIDKLISVLEGLIQARERIKASIYELTGISDIQRGVNENPNETATATNTKTQFGSLRLQRIQRDTQRYVRDVLRLKAEIMSEHFSGETLQAMTGISLPTAQDKQQIQGMLQSVQRMQQQPQQPGQPPQQPPVSPEQMDQAQQILRMPTWDDVMQMLKSDQMRQYRIDIETDSTIAETILKDTQGMMEAVQAIATLAQTFAPAIQMGMLSVDVFKTIATRIARSMRMGDAVEDAIDSIKQPPPQQNAQPQDNSVQVAQIKEQGAAQRNTETNQTKLQLAQTKAAADQQKQQLEAMRAEFEARDVERQRQHDAAEAERDRMHELRLADMEARFDAALKLKLGEQQQQLGMQQIAANERQATADRQSNEMQTAASLDSQQRMATEKNQSANLQAAAKIESADRQSAAKIESSDNQNNAKIQAAQHQTAVKTASSDRQAAAKIKSAERVNSENNKSKEKVASSKPSPKK